METRKKLKKINKITIKHITFSSHTELLPQHPQPRDPFRYTFPDRKPLLDYLTGKLSTSDSIEFLVPQKPRFPDLKDREALLECKDFYSLLTASTRREKERQRLESQQRKDGLVAKSRLMGAKPDVKVKQMKGAKPDCVTVQKKFSRDRDRVVTAYEVRDKPSALRAEDWDRVVAVFVLGTEWQFKDHDGDFQ